MVERHTFWAAPYKAPTIPGAVVLFLIIAFACLSFTRGADMAFGNDPNTVSGLVQNALERRDLWGWALMAGSAYLLLSLTLRVQGLVWVGHVFLCAVYAGLCTMLVPPVVNNGGDGSAAILVPIGGFLWHVLFVYLSRPFARAGRERV